MAIISALSRGGLAESLIKTTFVGVSGRGRQVVGFLVYLLLTKMRNDFLKLLFILFAILLARQNAFSQGQFGYYNQDSKFLSIHQRDPDSLSFRAIASALPQDFLSAQKLKIKRSGTCNTSTYYLRLSSPTNEKILLKDIQTLTNGNFLLAGNSISPAGEEGFITILSNSGNIVLNKKLLINGSPTIIHAISVFIDGRIVVGGIINDGTNRVFTTLLQPDLSVVWVSLLNVSSLPQKVTLIANDENKIAIAAQLSGILLYGILDEDGSILWTKQSMPVGLNNLISFTSGGNADYYLFSNCTRSGKKMVEFVRMDDNGNNLSGYTLGNGIDENYLSAIKAFNNRIATLGIVKGPSGKLQSFRDLIAPNGLSEVEHVYDLPQQVDYDMTSAFDNAGDVMGFCFPKEGKLIFLKHFAYYQTPPEHTREYDVPVGSTISAVSRSITDGGFLFGLNSAAQNELILIKTDSVGNLTGCGFKDTSTGYTETINKSNISFPVSNSPQAISFNTAVLSTNENKINSVFDCSETFCPVAPKEDTCFSSYFKTYRSSSYGEGFSNLLLMQNNKMIVGFSKYDRIFGLRNTVTYGIKSLDKEGHFIKGIEIFCDGISASFYLKKIDDQHFLALIYTPRPGKGGYTFAMFNDDLKMLWSKSYETASFSDFYHYELTTDEQGNIYFVGTRLGFSENAAISAVKLNSTGDLVWVKKYEFSNKLLISPSVVATKSSIIILAEGIQYGGAILRLDQESGAIMNGYGNGNNSGGSVYSRTLVKENNRIYYIGNDAEANLVWMVFDTTGKLLKSKRLPIKGSLPRSAIMHSGILYAFTQYWDGIDSRKALIQVDTALNLKHFSVNNEFGYPSGMGVAEDGSIYTAGSFYIGNNYYDAFVRKYNSDGTLGTCNIPFQAPVLDSMQVSSPNMIINEKPLPFQNTTRSIILPDISSTQNIAEIFCSKVSNCNEVNIEGPDNICSLKDTITYNAKLNTGCSLLPKWIADTSFVQIVSQSSSSVEIRFKKAGVTWIKSTVQAGCQLLTDSLLVTIHDSPQFLGLGADTILCKGDSLLLEAGSGFDSYKWQDGSDGNSFLVKDPGMYSIQVGNFCGQKFTDTILVKQPIVPDLNLAPGISACIGDSVHLKVGEGFIQYDWNSDFMITGYAPEFSFVPYQNGFLQLSATTSDGCKAYDTSFVTIRQPRPIHLGEDTSFCVSDSLTLFAGDNYLNYLWSTGATTAYLSVTKAGSFWVHATDTNGCVAKDTMIVQHVFTLPYIKLGSSFDICKGDQKILDAGNYSKYLWDDGSTGRYRTVNTKGLYWVQVTDNNNCSATDSTQLNNIFPVPSAFLKSTDSICRYQKINISSLNPFKEYLWSTGSVNRSTEISETGEYILTVTDFNNCMGKDTITIVSKENCIDGLFFPNAFTPNRDGKNDEFKALVNQKLTSFELRIYNQWGEMIFSTREPQRGWDGSVKGLLAEPGVFSWICTFQLDGGEPSLKKGKVTLIR